MELIERLASAGQLSWAAEQAWGDNKDIDPITQLEARASNGDTSWIPAVMLSSAEVSTTQTAVFNDESQTINANSEWANQASTTEINHALTRALEEYLHEKLAFDIPANQMQVYLRKKYYYKTIQT